MKTKFFLILSCLCTGFLTAQTVPYWKLGGNPPAPGPVDAVGAGNNIFGTVGNFPLRTITNNTQRMHINQTLNYNINGQGNLPKDGFIGIGVAAGFYPNSGGQGPFSLLHLNGNNAFGGPQQFGYRNWMQYGITSTHNQDFAFFGQRSTGGSDITDVVVGWADNAGGAFGPDNMVFNYLTGTGAAGNDLNGDANFGREIMRLTPSGQVGVGPRFNNANQPQSTFHINQENNSPSWLQISNQTNQSVPYSGLRGLRMGIDANSNAFLFNQENRHLIFSTNARTNNLGFERFRISAIGTPGTTNPGGLAANLSRVSLSHDPTQALSQPLSLLHLGYNIGNPLIPGTTSGWRSWMDVGMLVSQGTDHVYLGLKPEASFTGNRQDAVLAWGDDIQTTPIPGQSGPDRFRIIFTSPPTGQAFPGPGAMQTQNGLEFMRFVPNVLGTNPDPRVGLGDFNSLGVDPGNTFEINTTLANAVSNNSLVPGSWPTSTGVSGLRFRDLTSASTPVPAGTGSVVSTKVLTVDGNGDVVLVVPTASVNANSGLSINGGTVQLGGACSNTAQVAAAQLTNSRNVFLNSNNLIFGETATGTGKVGIGNITTSCTPGNVLEVSKNGTTPSAAGLSGLRLTDLKTGAGTVASNGKVLTVNANGDVVLTTDQSGSVAIGAIAAQNGLNLVGTNTVELGGTLIRPVTTIDFNGNELNYTNGSPTKLYVRGANGGTYNKAVGPPPFGTPETSFYEEVTATTPNSAFGHELNVAAASSTVGNFFLVGSRVIVNSAPVPSVAISGVVVGNWSRSQNTGASAKGNFAFKAEALGAGPTFINSGYISSATGSSKNYGFYAEMVNTFAAQEDIGIKSLMQANSTSTNVIGGDFNTTRGVNAYGVRAFAQSGTSTNYGVHASVPVGPAGSSNYGIYASAAATGGTVGPSYAGYFNGDVVRTGVDNFSSDQNLKQNIDSITNALGIIKQLKPKTFDYKQSSYPSMSLPGGKQYGLIAQDVQAILPELVNTISHPAKLDSLGNVITPGFNYLGLEYQQLIPFLIKGIQQQQRTIEKQDSVISVVQSQIAALTSSVNSCCSSSAVRTTSQEEQNQLAVDLSDKDAIILNQNVPNPFAEQTTITYNVPEKYGYAQMVFSTIDGRILKTVDITKKVRGTINVFANDLGSGMYTYSLIVDGKVIDTKKMVKGE